MHDAVVALEHYLGVTMKFFISGLFFFLVSSLLVVWILFDHQGALAANVLLFAMALFMIRQYRLIRRAFVAGLPATSGHVQGDPIRGLLTTPRREFGGAHVAFNNDYD
jgi:hypothetical protein